ncbi:MAG: hypothetical protein PHI90_08325 [Clostridia bacterium]|nr:hypothetical protein [Clostridia bacterium]MDD4048805.1 hypothetical protein [Clostridia bacterium]
MIKQLNETDRRDIEHIISKVHNNHFMHFDLSDEKQYRFYKRQLELAGFSAGRHKQLFKSVEEGREEHIKNGGAENQPAMGVNKNAAPVNVVTQINTVDGQNYSASALSSIPGGADTTIMTLGLYDENYNLLGPVKKVMNCNKEKVVALDASGSFSSAIPTGGRQFYAIATYQYEIIGEGTYKGVVPVSTYNFPKETKNVSPTQMVTHTSGRLIKVCLTRNDGDCDYWKRWSGMVEIPIKGSIEYFDNIDPILYDGQGKPTNASWVIQIARTDEGGNPIEPPSSFEFFKDTNTKISGKILSWDLGWMKFAPPNFDSGDRVYYIFSVTVQTGGKDVTTFITNAPSEKIPGSTSLNTTEIAPMEVVYGCLATGTKVRMADGSEKNIENIKVQEKILSNNDGVVLTIENTVIGTEEKPMIRLKDDKGHSLLLTDGHPVVTASGVLLAKELKVGDVVINEEGVGRLTEIVAETYADKVWNLHVGIPEDGIVLTNQNRTHFANGILVGDGVMQRVYEKKYKEDINNILKTVPEKWLQDYLNYIEDQKS